MLLTRLSLVSALAGALVVAAACRASEGARPVDSTRVKALVADAAAPVATGDTALERIADHARVEGNPAAPIWVVEVSDFQCPYCKEWHDQTYPTIKHDYVDAGKVRLAYINFPIPSLHRNAWPAAEAAMCAAAQNKFWPMHNALFATQDKWGELPNATPVFDSLATAAGVNLAPYHACIDQHQVRPLIQADVDRATRAGVNSTPTFLIDGTMVRGAQPTSVFQQVIDSALAKAAKK